MTSLSLILSGLTATSSSKPAPLGRKVSLLEQARQLFSSKPARGSYEAMTQALTRK